MCSCEFLLCVCALEFECLSLNTQDVELNLDFFRQGNSDSNEDLNDDVDGGQEDRLDVSDLGRISLVSE